MFGSERMSNVANGTLLGGGVLLTAGLVLALTAPSGTEDAEENASIESVSVRPVIGPGWVGLTGRF
jgi:hypothetical protein